MNDQLVALVRTVVPAVVGLLLAAAAKANIDIDGAEMTPDPDSMLGRLGGKRGRWRKFALLVEQCLNGYGVVIRLRLAASAHVAPSRYGASLTAACERARGPCPD